MDSQQRVKKFERTSQQQLQCYVQYVKSHPELLAGKNTPAHPRQMHDMWEEIASRLNALKGPLRTPVKWKESLANWKKQLRSRARNAKAERMRTGGGPKPAELSEFDGQALEALGAVAVEGISAQVLGFDDDIECCNSLPQSLSAAEEDLSHPSSSNFVRESSPPCSSNSTSRDSTTPIQTKKMRATQQLVDVVVEHIKKREEHDERMLQQQEKTADALAKIGQGLLALSEALARK